MKALAMILTVAVAANCASAASLPEEPPHGPALPCDIWADVLGGADEACPIGYSLVPDADTKLCDPSIEDCVQTLCCLPRVLPPPPTTSEPALLHGPALTCEIWADENGGADGACPSGYSLVPDADTKLCEPSIDGQCVQNCCLQWVYPPLTTTRRRDSSPDVLPPPAMSCTYWAEFVMGGVDDACPPGGYTLVPDADTKWCDGIQSECVEQCCLQRTAPPNTAAHRRMA